MFFFRLSQRGYIRDWRAPRWREPTLKELLSEPIITALMDADSVDPAEIKAILGETSVQLRRRANGSDVPRHKRSVVYADGIKHEDWSIGQAPCTVYAARGNAQRHDGNCPH